VDLRVELEIPRRGLVGATGRPVGRTLVKRRRTSSSLSTGGDATTKRRISPALDELIGRKRRPRESPPLFELEEDPRRDDDPR